MDSQSKIGGRKIDNWSKCNIKPMNGRYFIGIQQISEIYKIGTENQKLLNIRRNLDRLKWLTFVRKSKAYRQLKENRKFVEIRQKIYKLSKFIRKFIISRNLIWNWKLFDIWQKINKWSKFLRSTNGRNLKGNRQISEIYEIGTENQ